MATLKQQDTLMECLSCSHLKTAEMWIALEPLVSTENEISIYRLESIAGRYECTISGLRWVCESKVTLLYHFSSWDPHRAVLQSMGYRQAGPLLDIKIIEGKLKEVHLPHFACFGARVGDRYDPAIKQKVRVLHVEGRGVSIEQVDKVTRFHVKILHPSFSLRGVILQALGCSVHCDLQIYRARTAHLTLHAYLMPCDPALTQAVEKQEKCHGSTRILTPRPEKSQWLTSDFYLTTSCPSDVNPRRLELAHVDPPNFFEVFIRDADLDFSLNLSCKSRKQTIWNHEIRAAEYRGSILTSDQHFVDLHQTALIDRVSQVGPILDRLLKSGVITADGYSDVIAERNNQKKMRALFDGPLKGCGPECKDRFLEILTELEPYLINHLKLE
ncbi:NACHT, LRR and PYD domains-containing protein 1 homolog isoform X1 [Oncorhynchus mykiss]|uniref:NACHT, LRR and PYD domains-containing protein 1 homolog isoform X1 n=2 Tax=Oncorhynchus mykiss TaxID=8022 RepID=UPI000B4F20D3|nr:NACHT, LRR and PYD domains-containing protein 1 homolog isoform X1 [Oncorhynchus mykiss]XP_036813709.1 NACHT, LRR and PYD domains-containing protein 1 homolog isoform X1 [Oncorhynchus mykiss]